MPIMGDNAAKQRPPRVKEFYLLNRLIIVRASSLQPNLAILTAPIPDIQHLLNIVRLGKVPVPSRVFIPSTEISLSSLSGAYKKQKQSLKILRSGSKFEAS